MINENFTTHITFDTGDTHVEDTPSDKVVSTITRLLRGPAAMAGLIKEVKIVDMSDCIVFLTRGNKILFPAPGAKNPNK